VSGGYLVRPVKSTPWKVWKREGELRRAFPGQEGRKKEGRRKEGGRKKEGKKEGIKKGMKEGMEE
jgi:hypothetical protein